MKSFSKSILGGFAIGLGGLIFLSVDNKVIGSALFSIGLFLVLTMSLNLFTGKVCYVTDKDGPSVSDIVSIWVGNYIGTLLLAFILKYTRAYSQLATKAQGLCDIKNNDSYLSLFVLGILCNIFIFIAVDEFKNNQHTIGKYLAIVLGVMGFILSGTEHCIADMFYYNVTFSFTSATLVRLLVITAGNSVGGIFINIAVKHVK